jgi:homocitrate synthase NifV
VSIGAEDASRADPAFVLRLFETAAAAGACRVRYADTVGVHDPFSAREAIAALRARLDIDIDYHGRNDFGMSTANAFAAFKAGADVIGCSVNGLGERTGNTPLEEIVMAIKHLSGGEMRIDTRLLTGASALVERCSRRAVPEGKAVVGRQVHTHESGIHVTAF